MKRCLTFLCLTFLSLPLSAQSVVSDQEAWKELNQWGDKAERSRRYKQGEEIMAMIREAEERKASPMLKMRTLVLGNTDVLRMKAAGFSDEVIIQTIKSRQTLFDTTPNALIEMKQLGVSEAVIKTILEVASASPLIQLDAKGLPADVGVYYQEKDRLTEIDAEPISWQAGGVAKRFWTGAIAGVGSTALSIFVPYTSLVIFPAMYFGTTKGHVNAKVMGNRSRNIVASNAEFIVRTPESVSLSEYILVHLDEKSNRREFRLLTGGFIHPSSGAERSATAFNYRKIAPRLYVVSLNNLPRGEYGFLPTHLMQSREAAYVGKLYSFSID